VAAKLWEVAEARLPRPSEVAERAAAGDVGPDRPIVAYTQGLMDLGATLCTRRKPGCPRCPVGADCVARRDGRVDILPAPRPKRVLAHREIGVLVVRSPAGVLVERRPPLGVWGGLWSLPEVDGTAAALAGVAEACRERFGLCVGEPSLLSPIRHAFTHFALTLRPALVRVIGGSAPIAAESDSLTWLAIAETERAALPAPIKRLLRSLEMQ
jgi:A/G-specific adenine glycosylase